MKSLRMASADPFILDTLFSAFSATGAFEMLPALATGEALLETRLENTDIVFIDMDLPSQQGWELLEILGSLPLFKRPLIFVICRKMGEVSLSALSPNITYCFMRPFDPDRVVSTVTSIVKERTEGFYLHTSYELAHRMATETLVALGVPPHLQGYALLREGLKLLLFARKPTNLSPMQEIYPAVSALCGCTVSRAEHAMRHAIDTAWMRAPLSTLQNWFGYTTPAHRSTPSNSAFLFTVAEKLRHQLPLSPDHFEE